MLVHKWSRLKYLDPLVSRDIKKMLVATDNQLAAAGQGTGYEFVIIRVCADRFGKRLNLAHLSFD